MRSGRPSISICRLLHHDSAASFPPGYLLLDAYTVVYTSPPLFGRERRSRSGQEFLISLKHLPDGVNEERSWIQRTRPLAWRHKPNDEGKDDCLMCTYTGTAQQQRQRLAGQCRKPQPRRLSSAQQRVGAPGLQKGKRFDHMKHIKM